MLQGLPQPTESDLLKWIESALHDDRYLLAGGYQGKVLLYEGKDRKLVVKVPPQRSLLRWLYVLMLRHEYRAYLKLASIQGVPQCYGLLKGCYLVLEYVDGVPLRDQQPVDREQFFNAFQSLLFSIHASGVAHVDLKKKDNILVVNESQPYLIDFGVAVLRKSGRHPLNAYLFDTGKKFDLNAWIKHKYRKRYEQISEVDKAYMNRTWVERVAGQLKQGYRFIFKR